MKKSRRNRLKIRYYLSVKSEASEEAHALSSTQERKRELRSVSEELEKIMIIFVHTKGYGPESSS